jgi:tetratricopeptide (TPR) repeat protein
MLLTHVPDPQRDAFVRSWYRDSLAFKLAIAELDTTHFDRAIAIFPNDAVIRHLKGALHDAFAHPAVQSVAGSARLPRGIRVAVRSEGAELRAAESEYRRALDLDPGLTEARLRRGRVLARQGKHGDAVVELRAVLGFTGEPLLEYYARLFLGAEEETLGRLDHARQLYDEAAKIYPLAQSPRLASSQLAHRRGERAAARRMLDDALGPQSQRESDDPWWMYQASAGRQADEWREATYRLLPQ